MKKLFFIPFAFDEKKESGVNVKKERALQVYLKNLCVALISAKKHSPDADVALVTNIAIPEQYASLLLKNNVLIFIEPFDSFIFPNNYLWCLAFYKLCALQKMVEKYDYDQFVYTDADVIIQNPLTNIFEELKDNILLYDINHGLGVQDYRIIVQEFKDFGINSYITHYGGEFFGASKENAIPFINECKNVFNKMIENNFTTTKGDEFITSIVASKLKEKIKNAGAYIFRFWTSSFYLVSTCYKFNEIDILHLPDGKNSSIVKIYDKYISKNKFPSKKTLHRICHLNKQPLKIRIHLFIRKLLGKN